jgi:hypothetical protein
MRLKNKLWNQYQKKFRMSRSKYTFKAKRKRPSFQMKEVSIKWRRLKSLNQPTTSEKQKVVETITLITKDFESVSRTLPIFLPTTE